MLYRKLLIPVKIYRKALTIWPIYYNLKIKTFILTFKDLQERGRRRSQLINQSITQKKDLKKDAEFRSNTKWAPS